MSILLCRLTTTSSYQLPLLFVDETGVKVITNCDRPTHASYLELDN